LKPTIETANKINTCLIVIGFFSDLQILCKAND
jgi:hypothetical protein